MKRKKLLIVLAVVVPIVLLVAGLAGAVAYAKNSMPMSPMFFGWQGSEGEDFGPREGFGWMHDSSVCETVTEILGLSHDELRAELQAGKSLAEIAKEQGVEIEAVNDAINAAVEQAIADGLLSREQADWLLERLEEGSFPGGWGRGFGHRWGGGNHPGGECTCGAD